jgi:capsular exopolysaccharide synthesis family protein
MLGMGIIFALHRLVDRLELAEDVEEELEEPVLGQIPQLDAKALEGGCVLITKLDQHNMFAESIRGVRSAVLFGSNGKPKRVMLVSSAVPGDGKTTFTVNFAATLANAGQKVLLVDADLRRGNVHNYFGLPRDNGLTEVLVGEQHWQDVAHETEIKTLHVITSGSLPPNPGELLVGPITAQFVEEARQQYDHVLFDCPPLTALDDTFCLLGLSDGLLFVVKSGQTSMRFAKAALGAVRQRGAEIIGIVFNGITGDNPYYYYNYYYHAYYSSVEKSTKPLSEAAAPAKKMAGRRSSMRGSIAVQARVRAGQEVSSSQVAMEEQMKAEEFKTRRSIRREAGTSSETAAGPPPPAPANDKEST